MTVLDMMFRLRYLCIELLAYRARFETINCLWRKHI